MQKVNNTAIIKPIRSNSILQHWGSIEPLLEKALVKIDSGYSLDDVATQLQTEQMQLWVVNDWQAIAVTKLVFKPRHHNCTLYYLAGENSEEWIPSLFETLKAFAKGAGCKHLDFFGRKGWEKMSKPYGFYNAYTAMRMEL